MLWVTLTLHPPTFVERVYITFGFYFNLGLVVWWATRNFLALEENEERYAFLRAHEKYGWLDYELESAIINFALRSFYEIL